MAKKEIRSSKIPKLSTKFSLETLESPALLSHKKGKLYIGIPKDTSYLEKRVPLTPSAVRVLTSRGHRVIIESKAGDESHFYDHDYSEAGAEITDDKEEVFKAEIVLKVTPATPDEIKLVQIGQIIISPLQLSTLNKSCIETLIKKKITAIAFEYLKDDSGAYPLVRSMSEIAGATSIIIASEYLSHQYGGLGIMLGGISGVAPTKVIILGAGVVGEYAARTAIGLGANVKIFDNNIYKLMRLQNNIGKRVFTSVINPDVILHELSYADVAVGAIHSEEGRTPVIISEEMVSRMKHGSVIIDVSIDQGGCFETSQVTSHENPTFRKYGVIHYCVPNIPSRVSTTASNALSNILQPMLNSSSELGGIERYLHNNESARHGVYLYKGVLTNRHMGEKFGLKFTNINLLFAAEY